MSNYYIIVKILFKFSPPELASELAYELEKTFSLLSYSSGFGFKTICLEAK